MKALHRFPVRGTARNELVAELKRIKSTDASWKEGKMFGYIYYPDEATAAVVEEAYRLFMTDNALNPAFFCSLRKFENEVVSMIADLLNGDTDCAGSLTSGGTESIMMALKCARDKAAADKPRIGSPEVILPASAHPAFQKACHYLGLRISLVPVRDDKRADVVAMGEAVNQNTILIVASAPCYPHGVIDPVAEIGEIALRHNLLFHVDACVGGMMLPFLKDLGYDIPPFDFSVPGVTSISADIHKYGYSAKGASVIVYRDHQLRRHQFFVHTEWSGGLYGSPTMLGTRGGGPIASAWAVINHLGREGYMRITKEAMDASVRIRQAINSTPHLRVVSNPESCMFAFTSDDLNIFEIGDILATEGWFLDRVRFPGSLHMIVSNMNVRQADNFIDALRAATEKVAHSRFRSFASHFIVSFMQGLSRIIPEDLFRKISALAAGKEKNGNHGMSATMYGITEAINDNGELDKLVLDVLDRMY